MKIRIDGRDYDMPEKLDLGELAVFKQVAGVRINEIEEALDAGDPEVIIALCIVVKTRAGEKTSREDAARIQTFEMIPDETDEGDVDPPALRAAPASPPEDALEPNANGNQETIRVSSGSRS